MQTTPLKYRKNTTGSINLTLMPPPTAGVYSILAVVKAPKDGKTWQLAGRLDVLARTPKTYNVTLVPLATGHTIDKTDVRDELNNIWNQYGISWEVDVDDKFYVHPDDLNNKDFIDGFTEQDWADAWDEGDEFFSQYTSIQKAVNRRYNTYASSKNKYDNTRMYVFILPPDKAPYENQVGDMFSETRLSGVHDFRFGGTVKPLVELIPMSVAISGPLGKQWGYLFVNNFGSDDSHYRTLSHELGHGKTELEHTFAGNNTNHIIAEGSTNNLMDYSDRTDLVRFQWEAIHNPAIVGKWFQSDGDGAAISYYHSLPKALLTELYKVVNEIIIVCPEFRVIYDDIYNSTQYFSFQLYKLGDPYADPNTKGYFLPFEGTESKPHVIRFQPNYVANGVVTTLKRHSTVFEEFYHASEFLKFGSKYNLLIKETDVKVARAYTYYINGGYIGEGDLKNPNQKKLPASWNYSTDGWSRTFLYYNYQKVTPYYNQLKEGKDITLEMEMYFREAVTSFGKEVVYKEYNKYINEEIREIYKGETPYFDQLFK